MPVTTLIRTQRSYKRAGMGVGKDYDAGRPQTKGGAVGICALYEPKRAFFYPIKNFRSLKRRGHGVRT